MGLAFTKMHGLGNDFVIIDARQQPIDLTEQGVRAVADRHTGVGCDQLITLEPAGDAAIDVTMRIHNADGREAEACGNGTRCVARLLIAELGRKNVAIETSVGVLRAVATSDGITVDMGEARHDWAEIPLSAPADTLHLPLAAGPLRDPVAVNIGNPHAVFFVDNAEDVPLHELGPGLETHAMFPSRANIGIVQRTAPDRLRARVWERGVGLTRACGTGACAAVVAASRRGLVDRHARVDLDGGSLHIEWLQSGHVQMTGPADVSFSGHLDDSLLAPNA